MGLSFALFQVFLVPTVAEFAIPTIYTLFIGQFIEATGRLLTVYLATSVERCLAGYVYYLSGTALFVPLYNSLVCSYAPRELTSTVMGVSTGLGCVADIVSPTLGGWLLQVYGPFAPTKCASVLLFLGFIPVVLFAFEAEPDTASKKKIE